MKITVIGSGSTYTPELVNGFLERISTLPITELWLMDIDQERLNIVGGFAQRMVKAKGGLPAANFWNVTLSNYAPICFKKTSTTCGSKYLPLCSLIY